MTAPLNLEPLTRAAFAPFGDVIETAGARHHAINGGTAERYHDLARVDVGEAGGRALISIFRTQPQPGPVTLNLMERHPLASQSFHPLQAHDWLIVVAGGDDPLDRGNLRAFRAKGHQGVNYARNVWHHPLLALHADHDFLVVDRGGPGNNLEERVFTEAVTITL